MNSKKGSAFFGIAMGLFIFVIGVIIIPFFTDDITITRISLNCSGADTITDGTMIQCLMVDAMVPYWIWFFGSLAIGLFLGANQ